MADECQAYRGAGATDVVIGAVIFFGRLGSIGAAETVRQNHRRMSGEIGNHQLLAGSGRHNDIEIFHHSGHGFHGHHARAVGLNVFDGRDKTRGAESIGPVVGGLLGKKLVAAGAG